MTEDTPEIQKKKRGWPKGKLRKKKEQVMEGTIPEETLMPNICPVCASEGPFERCLIKKTMIDAHGTGFMGLICSNCGGIRIAKRPDGKFVYGYEEGWKNQVKNGI